LAERPVDAPADLPERVDLAVVGAGILGLATAEALSRRRPEWSIVVLEKEAAPALHQTGRNSCVIHSGVYYAPGSFKARLCTRGRELLLQFCDEEAVPYEICGKVIVAVDEGERAALDELEHRGNANGVAGLRRIGPDELRELEPHCRALVALDVPTTGLVDYRLVTERLRRRVETAGGAVGLRSEVTALREGSRGVRVVTTRGELEAARVVACGGLQADRLVARTSPPVGDSTAIVPFRGDYFALRQEARRLCRNLIYPVPDPRFPFLGVHVSRRPDGEVWAGPNAVLALAREGYRRRDVNARDALETLRSRAFWRLARRYWRMGLAEMYRDVVRRAFARNVARYLPEIRSADFAPAPAGIRPQALRPDGTLVDDFLFAESARVLHVKNAPSPAATSALAIAELVADRLLASIEA
jgi:(S)-2-hydroxyglutarate dehydrogenase